MGENEILKETPLKSVSEEMQPKDVRGFKQRHPVMGWLIVGMFIGTAIFLVLFGSAYVTCSNSGAQMSGVMSCSNVQVVAVCESLYGGTFLIPEEGVVVEPGDLS